MTFGKYTLLIANVLAWGCLAAWGWLTWIGINFAGDDTWYYVGIPTAVFIVATIPPVVLWKVKWVWAGNALSALTLLTLLPYLMLLGGGQW